MSERESVRGATLTRGREAEAAGVLLDSRASYPAFAAVFPEPGGRRRALAPFFRATVRDAVRAGVVHGARGDDGRLLGVAVWLPPGVSPLPLSRKLRMLPTLVRVLAAAPRSFPMFARFGNNVERAHPRDAHWYLVVLGVRAEAQRRGVGSALLEAGLRLVDADASDCYLETSDHANVPFYERFGFSVTAPAAGAERTLSRRHAAAVAEGALDLACVVRQPGSSPATTFFERHLDNSAPRPSDAWRRFGEPRDTRYRAPEHPRPSLDSEPGRRLRGLDRDSDHVFRRGHAAAL